MALARALRSGEFGTFDFDGYRGFPDPENAEVVPVIVAGVVGLAGLVRRRSTQASLALVAGAAISVPYLLWLASTLPGD